jgi:uridine kinase
MNAMDQIVEAALRRAQVDSEMADSDGEPVFIVGVDGHSAAGKSTLAGKVCERLGGTFVQMDDFYRVIPEEDRAVLTAEQGADLYFDHQRLVNDVLEPLSSHRNARFQAYDWDTNPLGEWRDAPASRFVVLEGVYSCRPELRPILGLTVLVEAGATTRRQRQLARGQSSTVWMDRWQRAEDYYFDQILTGVKFDVTVSGEATADAKVG